MSVQAMSWVMTHSQARLGDRLVMFSIANHTDSRGRAAWPSVATIAEEARLSERQVQRALPRLVEIGELHVEEGTGPFGTHRYSIVGMGDNLSPDNSSGVTKKEHRGDKSGQKAGQDVTQTVLSKPSLEPKDAREARLASQKEFEEWYLDWPHKVGRHAAELSFAKARRTAELAELKAAAQRYVANKPPDRPWCNPATWLNQERWLDQPALTGDSLEDKPTAPPPLPLQLVG